MRLALTTALLLTAPLLAYAQVPTEPLSACLADSTSGKDRKDLAKWVFLSMAAHPEIKQYAAPSASLAADDANKTIAALLMRLLGESCAAQTKATAKQGGSQAIRSAFGTIGQLAMQELMSDADVRASMGAFEKYLDQQKLNQALTDK